LNAVLKMMLGLFAPAAPSAHGNPAVIKRVNRSVMGQRKSLFDLR
jgi:hypothetical protein